MQPGGGWDRDMFRTFFQPPEDKDQVSGSESGGSEGDQGDGRHQAHQYHQPGLRVLPSGALITSSGHQMDGLSNLSMSAPGGGGLVQYAASQDGNSPFFVPSSMASIGSSGQGSPGEEGGHRSVQKREIRLLKNREAARECRRKKKEYIKCLENRVAVLENQNKALIEELKSLKELYTGGKMM